MRRGSRALAARLPAHELSFRDASPGRVSDAIALSRTNHSEVRREMAALAADAYIATASHPQRDPLTAIREAERALRLAVAVWQSRPGTVLLYGAATIHIALAFIAVCDPLKSMLMMLRFQFLMIFII